MSKYNNFKQNGKELRFKYCPICKKEKDNPCFSVNIENGNYYCFSTGQGGNIKEIEDFDFDLKNITIPKQDKRKKKDFTELFIGRINHKLNDEWIKYLEKRGISQKYLDKFCRISSNGAMMIPITDKEKVVGIKYRTLDKVCAAERGTSTEYFVNWQNVQDYRYLIIVEGEIDLLSVVEADYFNVVSLPSGATNIKCVINQKEWLKQFEKIIIAVDSDEAGEKCKKKIIKELSEIKDKLYTVDYGGYKDFNDVLVNEKIIGIKKAVTDAQKVKEVEYLDENGKVKPELFSQYLIDEFEIVRFEKELYKRDKEVTNYKKYDLIKDTEDLERLMISIIPSIKTRQRIETYNFVRLQTQIMREPSYNLVAFKNGVFDLEKKDFICPDEDLIFLNAIPWDYDPDSPSTPFIEEYLDSITCGVEELKTVLLEFMGFIFYRNNNLRKALLITGDKHNGKSKFFKLLEVIVGKSNSRTDMTLERLQDKFGRADIKNKSLIVCDDIDSGYVKETGILKKIITGDSLTGEKKFKDGEEFNFYGKLVISANEIPRFNDKTGALASRLIVVPFKANFKPGSPNCNPLIDEEFKKEENIKYLIKLSMDNLFNVLNNKRFTSTKETQIMLKEFEYENNPVLEFIEHQILMYGEEFYRLKSCNDIYEDFCEFNGESIFSSDISKKTFGNYLKKTLNLVSKAEWKDGKAQKWYSNKIPPQKPN